MNANNVTWFDFQAWARAAGVPPRMLSRWDADCIALQEIFLNQLSKQVH